MYFGLYLKFSYDFTPLKIIFVIFAVRLEIWFKIIIPLASCIYVEKLYICSDYHTQEASGKPAKQQAFLMS